MLGSVPGVAFTAFSLAKRQSSFVIAKKAEGGTACVCGGGGRGSRASQSRFHVFWCHCLFRSAD